MSIRVGSHAGLPISLVTLAAVALCAAWPLWPAHAIDTAGISIAFEKYTLPNGLEVILSRNPRLPIVTVNLWYHVGAVDEHPTRTGFAHLFEHMMFQGSAHVAPGQHLALLERAGASDLNASTDFDRTNYFETVPSNYLETVLWLESDRMGYLLDTLTAEKFGTQREVVKNERRQRVENAAYGSAEEAAWMKLFPPPHPYAGNVIGSMADLDAATVDDVRGFFREYYVPSNATLTVVGDFDPLWIKKAITHYFGTLPWRAAPQRTPIAPARIEQAVSVTHSLRSNTLPLVWFGWRSPPALTAADAAADILAAILSEGSSSRLYERLVREGRLAQSVSAHQQSLAAQSAFVIEAVARPGVAPEQVQSAIAVELTQIRAQGVTAAEVERARRVIQTRTVASLQSSARLADRLQFYNQYAGDPNYLSKDLARYEAVTPADVEQFAREVLSPEQSVSLRGMGTDQREEVGK